MRHIHGLAKELPDRIHVVDLGCGPGHYPLWLAAHTDWRFTLVDYAPDMLVRAKSIAKALGVADRITMIESDASNAPAVPSHSAHLNCA